jgi:iron complex outermembrane receptor protein
MQNTIRFWLLHSLAFFSISMPLLANDLQVTTLSEEDFFADIPMVLTATRLEQPLIEAPAAITVIDREMIKASGAREIADLFRLVPGFIVSHDDGHTPIVTYHGLNDEYVKRLQVLVDGRSVYSPVFGGADWTNLPLAIDDIDRIEVIRGPNAASYGSNSFLSVINIITKHASETTGTFVRFNNSFNNNNADINDGYFRFGDSTDTLDYRITLGTHNDDGFDERGDTRHINLAQLRADYRLNEKDTFMFQIGGTQGKRLIDSKRLQTSTYRNINNHFEQVRWQRQISNNDALSVQFFHTVEDADQIFDLTDVKINKIPVERIIWNSSIRAERFDLELQHTKQFTPDTRVVWGAGARQDSAKAPQIFGTDPLTGYTGNKQYFYNQLYRVFGNVEWRLASNVTLNLGAMWEKSDLANAELSPRLGINLFLTPEQTIRLSASKATRTPTLNESKANFRVPIIIPPAVVTTLWVGNEDLEPERITSYELGYHANLSKRKLSFDLKFYREELRDLITLDDNSAPNPTDPLDGEHEVYGNLTDATIDGVEAALELNATRNLRIILSHSITNIDSQNPNVSSDKLAASAPEEITSVLLIARFSGGIMGSLNYFRAGKSNGLGSGDPLPDYRRVDMRIGIPFRWLGARGEVAWVIQNMTGDYLDWRTDNTAGQRQYISVSAKWD